MDDPLFTPTSLQTQTEAITEPVLTDYKMDEGYFDTVLGAVITAVVLVLIGLAVVVTRYMLRHKGSYDTNEATEFADTVDVMLRDDPTLREAMDTSKKEYFI